MSRLAFTCLCFHCLAPVRTGDDFRCPNCGNECCPNGDQGVFNGNELAHYFARQHLRAVLVLLAIVACVLTAFVLW